MEVLNRFYAFCALSLGALGALAAILSRLVMPWREEQIVGGMPQLSARRTLAALAVGAVTAVIVFGAFLTGDVSLYASTGAPMIDPDFWRMTIVCLLAGALSIFLHRAAETRFGRGERVRPARVRPIRPAQPGPVARPAQPRPVARPAQPRPAVSRPIQAQPAPSQQAAVPAPSPQPPAAPAADAAPARPVRTVRMVRNARPPARTKAPTPAPVPSTTPAPPVAPPKKETWSRLLVAERFDRIEARGFAGWIEAEKHPDRAREKEREQDRVDLDQGRPTGERRDRHRRADAEPDPD